MKSALDEIAYAKQRKHGHHIWCNFGHLEPVGCRQCTTFWWKYPYDPDATSGRDLAAQHFPNAIVR